MNDKTKFEDFLFENWQTIEIQRATRGCIIQKSFIIKGQEYCIIARFSQNNGYVAGYLVDEDGTAIVNGKGFEIDVFIEHLKLSLKELRK
jgi:hypothetical protein